MSVRQHPKAYAPDSTEEEISKFWATRNGQAIIVRLVDFEGRKFIDIRRNFTDKSGRLAPTTKGVMLPIRKLPELVKAIQKANARALELGLLDDESEAGE